MTDPDAPAFWFGNIIATAHIYGASITTVSGILLVANSSQVTQEFSYFAEPKENSATLSAEVEATIGESAQAGDIIVYNGSTVSWSPTESSVWTGKLAPQLNVFGKPPFGYEAISVPISVAFSLFESRL